MNRVNALLISLFVYILDYFIYLFIYFFNFFVSSIPNIVHSYSLFINIIIITF